LRYDEITGVACRILPYRVRPAQRPDLDFIWKNRRNRYVLFALIFLRRQLPIHAQYYPEGKFRRGEACLFPNAFPYDQNNNVAILSSQHLSGWIN